MSRDYQRVTVLMKDGRLISGLERGRSKDAMTLATLTGRITVPRTEVKIVSGCVPASVGVLCCEDEQGGGSEIKGVVDE